MYTAPPLRRLRQVVLVEFLSDQVALYGQLGPMARCGSLRVAGLKQQQAEWKMLLSRQTAKFGSPGKMELSGLVTTKERSSRRLRQVVLVEFLVGRGGVVWTVGSNGALWKFAAGSWTKTAVSGIGDVAIAPNGLIWLAGKNGTVWSSPDNGVTFSQDEQISGIENIAAGRGCMGGWVQWHTMAQTVFSSVLTFCRLGLV